MILAADLHDRDRFDAIAGFDPARSVLNDYFYSFGALLRVVMGVRFTPRELYEDTAMFKKAWRDLSKAVAALECLARRLLLMLAAKDDSPLAPFLSRTSKPRAKPAPQEKPPHRQFRPEGLKAHFAFAPPMPSTRNKPGKRARRDPNKIYVPTFRLAARLEALIRIYRDPQAAAMKLRRKIARHALKHHLCVRMMAEPSDLNKDHPHLLSAICRTEADTLAANDLLIDRSG